MNSLMGTYTAALNLIERGIQDMSLMIQDCIERNQDGFVAAIGQTATSEIEMFKKLPLAVIGVNVNIGSTQEEKAQLNEWIGLDIKNNAITSDQAMEVQDALRQNVKLAKGLLRKFVAQNKKEAQQEQLQMIQANAQTQQQSTQVAGQMKQQEVQIQLQADSQRMQMEYQLKNAFEDKQFQRNLALQKEKNAGIELVAQINAGKQVRVQEVANDGKMKTAIIEGNNQIAKTSIVHHTTHSSLDHKHALEMEALKTQHEHELELQENEPPEKTEEKD